MNLLWKIWYKHAVHATQINFTNFFYYIAANDWKIVQTIKL